MQMKFCSVVNWVQNVDFSMYRFLLCFQKSSLFLEITFINNAGKLHNSAWLHCLFFKTTFLQAEVRITIALAPSVWFTEPKTSHKICGRMVNKYLLQTGLDSLHAFSSIINQPFWIISILNGRKWGWDTWVRNRKGELGTREVKNGETKMSENWKGATRSKQMQA